MVLFVANNGCDGDWLETLTISLSNHSGLLVVDTRRHITLVIVRIRIEKLLLLLPHFSHWFVTIAVTYFLLGLLMFQRRQRFLPFTGLYREFIRAQIGAKRIENSDWVINMPPLVVHSCLSLRIVHGLSQRYVSIVPQGVAALGGVCNNLILCRRHHRIFGKVDAIVHVVAWASRWLN